MGLSIGDFLIIHNNGTISHESCQRDTTFSPSKEYNGAAGPTLVNWNFLNGRRIPAIRNESMNTTATPEEQTLEQVRPDASLL